MGIAARMLGEISMRAVHDTEVAAGNCFLPARTSNRSLSFARLAVTR
jgi:hypothetical protein